MNDNAKESVLMASALHRWNDVRIFHKEARSLAEDYKVTVMGVNVDDGPIFERITILPLPSAGSLRRRITNALRILKEAARGSYKVFHFHDPELLWVGFLLKLFRMRVIYDVHEDTRAAIQIRTWLPKFLRSFVGKAVHVFELMGQLVFDGIIVAEDSYFENFFKRKNIVPVRNYVRVDDQPLSFPAGTKRILYSGSVTLARGIGDLLEAIGILQREDKNISATIVGHFATTDLDELHRLRSQLPNSERVEILPYIDYVQLKQLAQKCELAVVPLRSVVNYRYSIPTKILDYMNWGMPYVYSRLPLSHELFGEQSGGISFEPENVEDLAQKIRSILLDENTFQTMAEQGRQRVADFDWENEHTTLLRLYGDILRHE